MVNKELIKEGEDDEDEDAEYARQEYGVTKKTQAGKGKNKVLPHSVNAKDYETREPNPNNKPAIRPGSSNADDDEEIEGTSSEEEESEEEEEESEEESESESS